MNSRIDTDSKQKVLARLMQKTARGDWQAFSMLYAMTSSQMFGSMLHLTNYAPVCEDLLQEVYLTVWRRAGEYRPEKANVTTWLVTITRNRTLDWLRSQSAGMNKLTSEQSTEALDLASGNPTPEDMAESFSEEAALAECFDQLNPQQRQAIFLSYVKGHTHSELAEQLNSALGTVKGWVRRGLKQLKSCLQGNGGEA